MSGKEGERKLQEQLRVDLEDLRHWHNPHDAQKENAWLHKEFRKSRESLSMSEAQHETAAKSEEKSKKSKD